MSNVQFTATGTFAQVLAALDHATTVKAATSHAWEQLGFVGVTGVEMPRGLRLDFFGSPEARTIDAPEQIPLGHMHSCGQSWFWLR